MSSKRKPTEAELWAAEEEERKKKLRAKRKAELQARRKVAPRSDAEGQRFLSRAEVLDVVGVTYPALWQWMREGKFPLARELGERRVGWLASEVRKWMESRPARKLKGVA